MAAGLPLEPFLRLLSPISALFYVEGMNVFLVLVGWRGNTGLSYPDDYAFSTRTVRTTTWVIRLLAEH